MILESKDGEGLWPPEHDGNGTDESEKIAHGLRAFATPANFFFSSLSLLSLASILADLAIVRIVLADPAAFLVPFFGAIFISERSACRSNWPGTRVVSGEIKVQRPSQRSREPAQDTGDETH